MPNLDTILDIAIIFITSQAVLVLLLVLVLTLLMSWLSLMMRGKVVEVMPQVQTQAQRVADITENASQKVSTPFVRASATEARFVAMFKRALFIRDDAANSRDRTTEE